MTLAAPLSTVADEIGMNEHLAARVLQHKHLGLATGTVLLATLLARALPVSEASVATATAARRLLRQVLAQKQNHAPLSDAAAAQLLVGHGVQLSRRTIAKYRQELGVHSACLCSAPRSARRGVPATGM